MRRFGSFSFVFALAGLLLLTGCEPQADRDEPEARSERPGAPPRAMRNGASDGLFRHDVDTSAKPWTHLKFKNDPRNFQFAIVTDRTGGHREGVFEKGVDRLNLMQPEFVASVGDFIEGYTKDEKVLAEQWKEFEGFTARLQMPFFYLPGNHDNSNTKMAALWNQKFGRSYYAFLYRDVLFLCLDTQDKGWNEKGNFVTGLGEEQVAWAGQVLQAHKEARWTFVLMHQPLWVYEEGGLETERKRVGAKQVCNFSRLEEMLEGRKHTVIAGHFHGYVKFERRKTQYYILATTGGGSRMRGPSFGEFDHVLWVTMTEKGPVLANLTLDGILPDDIYTEAILRQSAALRAALAGLAAPLGEDGKVLGDLSVEIPNPLPEGLSLQIRWAMPAGCPWTIAPENTEATIASGKSVKLAWKVGCPGNAAQIHSLTPFPSALIQAKTPGDRLVLDNYRLLLAPKDLLALLQKYPVKLASRALASAPAIDGSLDEAVWKGAPDVATFIVSDLSDSPSAPTSAWVGHDATHLYFALRARETAWDKVVAKASLRDANVWSDDSFEIFINPDPGQKEYFQIIVNTLGTLQDGKTKDSSWNGEFRHAVKKEADAWTLELAVPWSTLGRSGPPAKGSRMGLNLQRNRTPGKPQILQWAPTMGSSHRPELFGWLEF